MNTNHVAARDDDQVNDVLRRERGVFAGVGERPTLVVVHSTVRPETCLEAAEDAPAATQVVDALVSGMRVDAVTGDLSLIVGGETDLVEHCRPAFETMGNAVFHVGALGAGRAGKRSNNLVSLSNVMTTAEGVRLGAAYGIDRETLLALFRENTADSWVVDNWAFISEEWGDTHPTGYEGAADIVSKDLQLVLELARAQGCDSPGAAVASQRPALLREFARTDE
nr:NAD(P)-binding domain-containing protein [Haloplanus sp. HW8-1]